MFSVREGRSGDMGSGHKPSKGRTKKSNWDLMGKGKGHEHLKQDLDEKGEKPGEGVKQMSGKAGTKRGTERKTKKGAY